MAVLRTLLSRGNGKLGGSIHHFDLPPIVTCPGSTEVCRRVCYARQGHFVVPTVKAKLAWNLEQTQERDFEVALSREIRLSGVEVLRLHVAGDFYSAAYARRWLRVMRRHPGVRFYFYTRSWRVPAIVPVLRRMAALPNVRAWCSVDEDTATPAPEDVPPGFELAYLQVDVEEQAPWADLVFRVRRLRGAPRGLGLPMICPHETPAGRAAGTTCGSCQHCWR